jgi:hypothetical protein
MNEAAAYAALRPRLQARGLDPQRVENVLAGGTPDCNYSAGWIEMKYLEAWPKRESTLVIIRTLVERPEQVAWLRRRWTSGGAAWIMLRVDRQLLLFAAPDARAVRLGRTRAELMRLACWKTNTQGVGDWEQLRDWLLWKDEELPPPARAKLLRLRCGQTVEGAAAILGVGACAVERAEAEECPLTNDLIDAWAA